MHSITKEDETRIFEISGTWHPNVQEKWGRWKDCGPEVVRALLLQ